MKPEPGESGLAHFSAIHPVYKKIHNCEAKPFHLFYVYTSGRGVFKFNRE
jgi:hypothetical protein